MDNSIKKTIERMKSLPDSPMCASDVAIAFIGEPIAFSSDVRKFRDSLVDILSQCDPDEWSDEFLADNGLMRLPVDADGDYVHVDDEMVDERGDMFTVNAIGSHTLYYYDDDTDTVEWTRATNKRHYKPDTWEKIIEDALGNGSCYSECDVRRLVDRCKALAGGAE